MGVNRRWKSFSTDGLEERKQISEITPELLQSGEWKDAEFRYVRCDT